MSELLTNFKDDILAESMEGRRRYQMITNEDGTVSFVDVTEYEQIGSEFGQAEVNAIHREINRKFDSGDVVDPLAAEEAGFAADAKLTGDALREVSANFIMAINAIGDAVNGLGATVPEGSTYEDLVAIITGCLYYKAPSSGITISRASMLSGNGAIPIQIVLYTGYSGISGTAFTFSANRINVNHKCTVTVTAYVRVMGPSNYDTGCWFYLVVNGSAVKSNETTFRGTATYTISHTFVANPDDYITTQIQVSNPQNKDVYADSFKIIATAKAI